MADEATTPAAGVVPSWGVVPGSVRELFRLFAARARHCAEAAAATEWPEVPGDITDPLLWSVSMAEGAALAAKDLRAALSAYAYGLHQPRPVLAQVARAQGTSPQGLIRRFSVDQVEAINALLSATATQAQLCRAFASLTQTDAENLLSVARGNTSTIDHSSRPSEIRFSANSGHEL